MDMIHVPSVFLFLSFIYLLIPVAIWIALNNQKSRSMILWCLGGELFAIGLMFIGLRPVVPAWLSYTVANGLSFAAVMMQVTALRSALHQPPWVGGSAVMVVFWLTVFEYFRVILQNAPLRFGWSLMFFAIAFSYVSYLCLRISVVQSLRNARLLGFICAVGALILYLRIWRIAFGYTEPDVAAQGVDSILVVFSGVVVCVLGGFAFVGLFLEQAVKREMLATEARVRQEESMRLGAQIAQLERQQTLGAMSYSFAHELSQPLTAILMETHGIKLCLATTPLPLNDIRIAVNDVERSATRTIDLIDRIRNFVRPSKADHEAVDMKTLVREVKSLLAYEIRKTQTKFAWNFDEADCTVYGDRVQLSQVILNVYRNAMQAMLEGERRAIDVSVRRENERVSVQVQDSGSGIAAHVMDQVGQPFVTTKSDGLGVGLSISKTITEMHSGGLTIANATGGGALVTLDLPAYTGA